MNPYLFDIMSLRVAYVVNIFPKVSETFIAHELAELRRRGVELRVLSLLPPRESMQHEFIEVNGLPELVTYDVAGFPALLREFRPDIIHAHFATEPTAMARELSQACQVPFTFTAHGYDIRRKPPSDLSQRAHAAARVITVSQANARHLRETFAVPSQHIAIIPCGVDTGRFSPSPNAVPVSSDPVQMVCVARHVAVKNLRLLLDACVLLRERGCHFHCVSVGDGPLRAELEAARLALGLGNVVTLTGALTQDEVLRWWRRADLAVLTSDSEGMPVCLMEAAACGVPAVATAVGGVPELIVDGKTGVLTPPGDAGALADALQSLVGNVAARTALGTAARERAERSFSLQGQGDALLKLWNEVLSCRQVC